MLAIGRSTGALEIRGHPAGTVYLDDGDITYAEAPGVPELSRPAPGEEPHPEAVRAAVREAGLILLTGPRAEADRPLFRPGRGHWAAGPLRLAVESVLADAAHRAGEFAALGVDPDRPAALRGVPRGGVVRLTAADWDVLAAVRDGESARTLAATAGLPLSGTLGTLARLIEAGLVEHTAARPARPHRTAPPAGTAAPARTAPPAGPTHVAGPTPRAVEPASSPAEAIPPVGPNPAPAPGANGERRPARERGVAADLGAAGQAALAAQPATGPPEAARNGSSPHPAPPASLPRRMRGSTSLPAVGIPIARPDHALTQRLLDGLRRL